MTELVRPFAWANHICFDPFPCFNIVLARCLRVLRFYHRDPSGKSALPPWHWNITHVRHLFTFCSAINGAISITKFNGHMFNPKVRIEIWVCHVWKAKCPGPPTGELQYIAIYCNCGVILWCHIVSRHVSLHGIIAPILLIQPWPALQPAAQPALHKPVMQRRDVVMAMGNQDRWW